MKAMSMEKAVEYCKNNKKVVLHIQTQEEYDKLGNYIKNLKNNWFEFNWFLEHKENTCINFEHSSVLFCNINWYRINGYEVIELTNL